MRRPVMRRPVFTVDWLELMAIERSQWATVYELEQALEEAFELLNPTDLASFGDDNALTPPPPGWSGDGVAQ